MSTCPTMKYDYHDVPCGRENRFPEWFKFYKKQLNKKQIAFLNLLLKNGFELQLEYHRMNDPRTLHYKSRNEVMISYFGDGFNGEIKFYY